jgi:chitodextrinase
MTTKKGVSLALASIAIFTASFGFAAHAQEVGVTLPSVPTNVSAAAVPPSQVSISWSASTESSGVIEGYYVYRNGSQIATTNGTSLTDAGLLPGFYSYAVAAYDANGNVSAQSTPAGVTLIPDTTPPTTPTGVTVSGTTSTNSTYTQIPLTVSWNASTDNVGVAGYYVYRNRTKITTSTTAFTGTSITDTVTPGTYTYTVVAYDAAQNFSDQSAPGTITILVDNAPPSIPTNLSAQQVSATGVNLSWATSTDGIGVAGYQVYRNGIQIASAAGPSYADGGLSTGVTYTYAVAAYDAAGNISELSPTVQVNTQPLTGPSVPQIYSATALGTSTVDISWTPSSDILAITAYTIYRNGTQIASVTSTSYMDEALASGTYAYSVSATDVSGVVSAQSATATAIVPAFVSATAPSAAPSVIPPPSEGISPASAGVSGTTFSQTLYSGLRGTQVEDLQSFLASYGYLSSADTTGFFGTITLHAVEKFQCDKNIVCTGGAGWGTVGPKTRSVLNGLQGNSASALNAEIQTLQAELANLEKQIP